MQSSLYVALSAQVAMERRLNTIANNVANMNTGGFRADEVKFEEILSLAAKENVSFASSGQNFISRRTGPMTKTDNPLDVAIQGDGWFAFQGPSGPIYTRDGRFKMNENGDLLTVDGYQVLDAGGAPIALDPMAGSPIVGRDGTVMPGHESGGSDRRLQSEEREQADPLREFGRPVEHPRRCRSGFHLERGPAGLQ